MEKEGIFTKNHGTKPMDLTHLGPSFQFIPTELHLKENGTITEEPSFAIVMQSPGIKSLSTAVIGQVSLKMLNEAMEELGYRIEKIT
jgi:hypothetical protein